MPPLADLSLKKYTKDLDQLKKAVGSDDIYNTMIMIPGVKALRKRNGEEYSFDAQRGYFNALAHFTKHNEEIHDIYVAERDIVNKKKKIFDDSKEAKKIVPYELIQRIGKIAMNSTKELLETRILMGLITQLPPLRLDYSRLVINPAEDYKGNYLRLGETAETSEIVVQEHKTAKTYETLRHTLIEPIFLLFKEWHEKNPGGTFLNITESGLSHRIKSIFERLVDTGITMTHIRHSYVNEKTKSDRPKKEIERVAHEMGHSVAMSWNYRTN